MFNKKIDQAVTPNPGQQEKAAPSIEELAERVIANKKRAEDQKQTILNRIDELKKKLGEPKHIKNQALNTFSIEDIEKSVEPVENREEIAHKIASLMVATELPIYCDKQYMDSIHEYYNAIRPVIEELEKKQYEALNLKMQKEAEAQSYISKVMKEYYQAENEILGLLDVVHGLGWLGPHYNKQLKYINKASTPFTNIIDSVLDIDDGNQFKWFVSMH